MVSLDEVHYTQVFLMISFYYKYNMELGWGFAQVSLYVYIRLKF